MMVAWYSCGMVLLWHGPLRLACPAAGTHVGHHVGGGQGDGANDIPMLKLAGLGVAFHAKPKVKEQAKVAVSTLGLDGILYLLGIRDSESLVGTHNSTSLPETPVPRFAAL